MSARFAPRSHAYGSLGGRSASAPLVATSSPGERPALEALLRKYRSQALAELRVVSRLKRMLQRWVA
jgi:hypothetical protein